MSRRLILIGMQSEAHTQPALSLVGIEHILLALSSSDQAVGSCQGEVAVR